VGAEGEGVHGCRHEDDAQVGLSARGVAKEGEEEVCVEIALVHLGGKEGVEG
jgi:hypothetical protein